MEMTPMTSARRLEGVRPRGRAANAFDTVAWRPPSAARFDTRVANDVEGEPATRVGRPGDLPDWVVVAGGGLIAALMGALAGGVLAL
jgi:hypothetical protein